LSYQVSYIYAGVSKYTVVKDSIVEQSTIITGLTPGVTYRFIVKARNRIGISEQSTSLAVLAA
jgi:hypothetical protein